MAINSKIDTQKLIDEFIKDSKFLQIYESTDNILNDNKHDYNLAKKISAKLNKTIKMLISEQHGLEEFIKLLDNRDIIISSSAAEFLYPLYPTKCINILYKYSKSLNNKLDKHKVDCMINGFKEKQTFFISPLKKIYNVEDLESLNREK